MTDRICIASNGAQNAHISADDLTGMSFLFLYTFLSKFFFYLACCSSCGYGCDGGFPQAAWSYYKETGLVTGGNYNTKQGCEPYTIPSCDHQYVSLITSVFSHLHFFSFLVSMELYHQ